MKRLYKLLSSAIWCFVGVFIGNSLSEYMNYKAYPKLYEAWSTPWYFSIEVRGAFTLVIVLVLLLLMWLIRRHEKKRK